MVQKTTLKPFLSFLITCLFAVSFGFGQIKLGEVTFETPEGYTTNAPEYTDGAASYFIRTDGADITGENFSNTQGSYYFAAQNTTTIPSTLLLNDINISGYSSLEFRVHLAEDDNGATQDWDGPDFVHINYDIDNTGAFSNLIWVEATGTNTEPQIDTNYDGIGDGTAITDTFTQFTQSIVGTGSVLDIEIEIRLNTSGDDIAIDNIEIWGTLTPCGAAVTWDGSAWDNAGAGPDITTEVIINGDYDTTTASFSACSLTVNNNASLNIANNTYIEIQNDITVDAGSTITVQPYGAVVQKNDFGNVTNNGTMEVVKKTSLLNNWYEYTYWSSPVLGETIGNGLFESDARRRFLFNAQNFLDASAETGNDNTPVGGLHDDIDDNGNDWKWVNSTTPMTSGVGYAATHDENFFVNPGLPPYQFDYTFEGPFNNRVITVPVYRNDSELGDNNWNLIGNPYPSAIDADLFLAANTEVDNNVLSTKSSNGAIFFWSQNTDYSPTANGNEQLNFSSTDYAIINGVGEVSGGDGVLPTRFIPSGQAFFISYSNTAMPLSTIVNSDGHTISQGEIIFNNTMRVRGATDNAQFFKNSTSKNNSTPLANKLWINLTSDNGVFNQTLIGYVKGATNTDDGSYFDTEKNGSAGTSTILYTTIGSSNKKFAIQGKAESSLDANETIKLGFKTSINVATLYTLSIAQLQGEFLKNNTIYLKDNLLNKAHNLCGSDYTFTSEVGEFNDRFVVMFNNQSLSTNELAADTNTLKIIDLDNDRVKFTTTNDLTIKTVSVFDLLGRELYTFKGQNSEEIYHLTSLKNAVYIAKVELSNGSIITKKAIKK